MTRRTCIGFLLAATVVVTVVRAQPASIASNAQRIRAAVIFSPSGDQYYFGTTGPVTPGAVQAQNGGGTCLHSNGFFSFPGPCDDAYVAKVDSSGNLVFGTYLGGSTEDEANALATDAAGNVFVAGSTGDSFPTTARAASVSGSVFAAKFSADGRRLLYSTYLPESAATAAGIAVDAQGNAFVAGTSRSGHAYVVKISPDGSAFLYNVSLAGSGQDSALAMSGDAEGNVIVAGQTNSPDFPSTPGAMQPRFRGAQDAFVAKLDARGGVVFSTYLGGSGTDAPTAVQGDSEGNVYVAGQTKSFDFPTTNGSFQPTPAVALWNNTGPGGFVAKISASGDALGWSTYVMSVDSAIPNIGATQVVNPQQAGITQLAVTRSGDVYIAGLTGAGFPVTGSAPQACFEGVDANVAYLHANAFIARLDSRRGAIRDATYAGRDVAYTSALSIGGNGTILLAADGFNYALRFGGEGWSAPPCVSTSVLNSATFSGGLAVVPGEFITLTGIGMGPEAGVAYQPDKDGKIPRQIGGVQVLFDDQPAPVLYAQSRQINALVPTELSGRLKTNIRVLYNQATIGQVDASVAPNGIQGVFRLSPGVSSQAAALNQDGTPNSPSNPAARGSIVSVWGTGFGLIDPGCASGGLNPPGPVGLAPGLGVWIAHGTPGQPTQFARAEYAGSAPGLPCGVTQINFRVPTDIPAGPYLFMPWSGMDLPGGAFSASPTNFGATISVK